MTFKITSYAQRYSVWAGILLGYNTQLPYTIGLYGCLITCLASYLASLGQNETPASVNQKLKDNQGFQSGGGLFLWNKCTVLGLNQLYVSPKYDGPVTDQAVAKAKELLDQGYPLLAEIDFNPATIGEEMHFILICGCEGDEFWCMDPWQGQVVKLDTYGGFKRAIIQFRSYDKLLTKIDQPTTPTQDSLAQCQTQLAQEITNKNETWQELQQVKTELNGASVTIKSLSDQQQEFANRLKCDNQPSSIDGEIDKLLAEENQLTQVSDDNKNLKVDVDNLTAQLTAEKNKSDNAISQNNVLSKSLQDATNNVNNLSSKLQKLQNDYNTLKGQNKYIYKSLGFGIYIRRLA